MPTAEEEIQTHSFLQSIQNFFVKFPYLLYSDGPVPTKKLHEVLNLDFFFFFKKSVLLLSSSLLFVSCYD